MEYLAATVGALPAEQRAKAARTLQHYRKVYARMIEEEASGNLDPRIRFRYFRARRGCFGLLLELGRNLLAAGLSINRLPRMRQLPRPESTDSIYCPTAAERVDVIHNCRADLI
ncbi:MAG TPA: hypothetical protein VK130_07610 [Steroidobacteraceae bacterium]|nr:hypothetical protein [Steroidobacteraceae bacterium]